MRIVQLLEDLASMSQIFWNILSITIDQILEWKRKKRFAHKK